MPVAPAGRHYSSAHLIRIVDPLGGAIAWFAPELGACCAGYSIRQVSSASPVQTIRWREIITGSAITHSHLPTLPGNNHDANAESPWQFVERDPASCTMERIISSGAQTEHWRIVASLAHARLSLCLTMWNTGATPVRTGTYLHLVLSSPPEITLGPLSPATTMELPGYGSTAYRQGSQQERVAIAVEAFPGTCTIETDDHSGKVTCTITYHPPSDPRVLTGADGCQRLSIVIGSPLAEPGIEE